MTAGLRFVVEVKLNGIPVRRDVLEIEPGWSYTRAFNGGDIISALGPREWGSAHQWPITSADQLTVDIRPADPVPSWARCQACGATWPEEHDPAKHVR